MKIVLLFIGVVLVVRGDESHEARCRQNVADYNQCTANVHRSYVTAISGTQDGRPDFNARKTCTYVIDASICWDLLLEDNCKGPEEVQEIKNNLMGHLLSKLEYSNIPEYLKGWDSFKCPPIKAYIDRLKTEEEMELGSEVFYGSSTTIEPQSEDVCGDLVYCEAVRKVAESYWFGPHGFISYDDNKGDGDAHFLSKNYVLGSIVSLMDTNDDSQVSFEELLEYSKIHLNNVFNAFDIDNNTHISNEEAISAVTRANFGVIENFLLELFSLADLNNDGELSTQDLPGGRNKRNLDQNQDGEVSLEELLGRPIILFPGPVQTIYKALDSNKDEVINMGEANNFINFLGKIFNVLDSDYDCYVDLDEALLALGQIELSKDYQLALELTIRPASALARFLVLTAIVDIDGDNDSEISLNEFLTFSRPGYVNEVSRLYRSMYSGSVPHRSLVAIVDSAIDSSTSFLTGNMDIRGRWHSGQGGGKSQDLGGLNYQEANVLQNHALSTWLSLFQGFLAHPRFNQERPVCN